MVANHVAFTVRKLIVMAAGIHFAFLLLISDPSPWSFHIIYPNLDDLLQPCQQGCLVSDCRSCQAVVVVVGQPI